MQRALVRSSLFMVPSVLVLLLAASYSISPKGQSKSKPSPMPSAQSGQEINPDDVISVNTSEVLLPVTVRDSAGRLVNDLTRGDFRIFEDGVQQSLTDLSLRQVPVDVVLIVDASYSVADNLDDFRIAANGFAAHLAEDDRISLIQFDDKVVLLQDWTRSLVQFRRALKRIVPGMFTRFHDALLLASVGHQSGRSARHAIIVLTDGVDSGRGASFEAALRAALQFQITVYVISNTRIERAKKQKQLESLLDGSASAVRFNQIRIDDLRLGLNALAQSERQLQQLAAATGGRLYKPISFLDLERTYAEVAEELRHQYALYYSPLLSRQDGQFRTVRVETTNSSHRISSRIGYYAPNKRGR